MISNHRLPPYVCSIAHSPILVRRTYTWGVFFCQTFYSSTVCCSPPSPWCLSPCRVTGGWIPLLSVGICFEFGGLNFKSGRDLERTRRAKLSAIRSCSVGAFRDISGQGALVFADVDPGYMQAHTCMTLHTVVAVFFGSARRSRPTCERVNSFIPPCFSVGDDSLWTRRSLCVRGPLHGRCLRSSGSCQQACQFSIRVPFIVSAAFPLAGKRGGLLLTE